MHITELKNEGVDLQVKVTLPSTDIASEIQKELANISQKAKIAGFRVGKVPISIINKKYGASVRNEILQHQFNKTIKHIIQDRKLEIATDPQFENISNEEGKDVEFILKFELIPQIDLSLLNSICIEKPVLLIRDHDINHEQNKLVQGAVIYNKESKGKAVKEDQVTIDGIGYIDGKTFEGGKLEKYQLVLGSQKFIAEFEEQLIGVKTGDAITVKVTFPTANYSKDLAGKSAEFAIKILAVHKPTFPEVNDEFAKNFNCDNVEQLRAQISKQIQAKYAEAIHISMKMSLFNQLEGLLQFDVPKSLLDREHSMLKNQAAKDSDTDEFLKEMSIEEAENYYKKLAMRRVRIGLMLAEYAKAKALRVEEEDIKNAVLAQIEHFPGQEREVIEFYQKNSQALSTLTGPILEEKATQQIFNTEIKFTEESYTIEEFEQFLTK